MQFFGFFFLVDIIVCVCCVLFKGCQVCLFFFFEYMVCMNLWEREHHPLLKVWLRHSHSLHHQSALWCLSASPRTPTASLLLLPPLLRCQTASLTGGAYVSQLCSPVKNGSVEDTKYQLVMVNPLPSKFPSFFSSNLIDRQRRGGGGQRTGFLLGIRKRDGEIICYMQNISEWCIPASATLWPLPQTKSSAVHSTSCLETPTIGNALAWWVCSTHSSAVYPLTHPLSHGLSSSLPATAVEARLAHE